MVNRVLAIILLVVFGEMVAYRLYRRSKARVSSNLGLPQDPNQFMPDVAAHAVQAATEKGKTLDYSPESVKTVESILGELHDEHAKGTLSDNDVNVMAIQYGAYVGEVLRRKYGGSWAADHSVAGPKSYPIHWQDHDSFPVAWCGKRILNGDKDNVWFKFQVVTSDKVKSLATSEPVDPTSRP